MNETTPKRRGRLSKAKIADAAAQEDAGDDGVVEMETKDHGKILGSGDKKGNIENLRIVDETQLTNEENQPKPAAKRSQGRPKKTDDA